jgi:hypothetical protein
MLLPVGCSKPSIDCWSAAQCAEVIWMKLYVDHAHFKVAAEVWQQDKNQQQQLWYCNSGCDSDKKRPVLV